MIDDSFKGYHRGLSVPLSLSDYASYSLWSGNRLHSLNKISKPFTRVKLTILKPAKIYRNPDNLKLSWTGCATGYRKRKDTMKGKKVYSRIDLTPKIIPLRLFYATSSFGNPKVIKMQILVTWTGQTASRVSFLSSTKKNKKCSWSYFLLESRVRCLDFKAYTFEKRPVRGLTLVTFVFSSIRFSVRFLNWLIERGTR